MDEISDNEKISNTSEKSNSARGNENESRSKKRRKIGRIAIRKKGVQSKKILKKEIKAPTTSISEEDFKKALKCLENNKRTRDVYKEKCSAQIHFEERNKKVNCGFFVKLLEEARKCLLRKDWDVLARVLVKATPCSSMEYSIFFPIFLKYAVICLSYNPEKKLLDLFYQSVLMCSSQEEKREISKKIFL